jgi:hypothetical protein
MSLCEETLQQQSVRLSRNCAAPLAGLLLAACAAPGSFSLFTTKDTGEKSPSPAAEEAETCRTPQECADQLRKLIKDPKREWIGQPQSPAAYSNGTRLFAYRALRKKLTCSELDRALSEFKVATPSLQSVRYDRVRILLAEVTREIKSEEAKRCRPHQ